MPDSHEQDGEMLRRVARERAATASSDPAMAIKTLPGAKGSRPIPGLLQFPGATLAAGQNAKHSAPLRKRASPHDGARGSTNQRRMPSFSISEL
jgi:hypothetical protein